MFQIKIEGCQRECNLIFHLKRTLVTLINMDHFAVGVDGSGNEALDWVLGKRV